MKSHSSAKLGRPSRSPAVLLAAICILSLLVSACSKPPAKSQSASGESGTSSSYDPKADPLVNPPSMFLKPQGPAEVDTGATLNYQLRGSPNTLNGMFVSSLYEFGVVELLYDQLFVWGSDLQIKPNDHVVEHFEESEDHTTFILRLKPGLKWHDGRPFTAHDVVFSWEKILDDKVPALTFKSGLDEVKECVALDDRTVRFVQPNPLATRIWNLQFPIIPKHIFEKHMTEFPDLKTGEYYNNFARKPVGWGPYRLVEWKDQDKIVLERWEDFHGVKPHFKRVIFHIIPEDTVALLSFEKGTIDVHEQMTPQQFAIETTQSAAYKAVGYKAWFPEWSFRYIGWNMDGSNHFFNDKRVRYAMTHALNLPLMIDQLLYNLETPCSGIYHPDSWMYNSEVQLLGFDLKKAAALLDEAGWTINPADGWRYKTIGGSKIAFEFTLLLPQGRDFYPKVAAIYQEDLKKIGVRMNMQLMEWSAFLEKVRKHEFQAQMSAWGTGTDPDTGWNLWRTEMYDEGRNYGGYSNPQIDKLFEDGRREFDREKRAEIYQQIHKIIYDDQPYTFVTNVPALCGINKRIHGVEFSPRGLTGFSPALTAWWVSKGKVTPAVAQQY